MFNAGNRIAMGDGKFALLAGSQTLDFIGIKDFKSGLYYALIETDGKTEVVKFSKE